jgi:hypothetical protein
MNSKCTRASPRVCYFYCDLPSPKKFTKLKKECISKSVLFWTCQNFLSLLYICIRDPSLIFISFFAFLPGFPPWETLMSSQVHVRIFTRWRQVFSQVVKNCSTLLKYWSVFSVFLKKMPTGFGKRLEMFWGKHVCAIVLVVKWKNA